jgi:hypothetical protein
MVPSLWLLTSTNITSPQNLAIFLWKPAGKNMGLEGFFAGKMRASNTMYNLLWVQEDERRAGIVNPAEKYMDAAGIELVTSR